jgi:cyanate permease
MMVRITRYVFGVKALGPIFSLLMISDGIGVAVGPVLAGLMFDITGSYFSIFLMVSAALAGAAVATATLRPTRQT